ncbi:unnamed protein product, partial [marine sediment metagenome]
WNSRATLKFLKHNRPSIQPDNQTAATPTQDYYLSEATASDKVVALSDKFTAQANHMYIKLGPPGSDGTERGQEIQLLQAKDDFFSVLSDDNLSISADSMETHFTRCSSGKGQFPSTIELEDNVQAIQQPPASHTQSTLQCQEMLISLVESNNATASATDTYANSKISHLFARGQVIGRYEPEEADPSNLSAHTLEWDLATKTTTLKGGLARVELEHPKDEQGKEEQEKDWLESAVIHIVQKEPDDEDEASYYLLSTPGPGKMRTSFAGSEKGADPAPVGLNWPGSMLFHGLANKASFTGTDDERVKGAIVHSPHRWSEIEA